MRAEVLSAMGVSIYEAASVACQSHGKFVNGGVNEKNMRAAYTKKLEFRIFCTLHSSKTSMKTVRCPLSHFKL